MESQENAQSIYRLHRMIDRFMSILILSDSIYTAFTLASTLSPYWPELIDWHLKISLDRRPSILHYIGMNLRSQSILVSYWEEKTVQKSSKNWIVCGSSIAKLISKKRKNRAINGAEKNPSVFASFYQIWIRLCEMVLEIEWHILKFGD